MVYNSFVKVLDKDLNKIKTIQVDMQSFDEDIKIEDYTLHISKIMYCNNDTSINIDNYISYQESIYKIIEVNKYDYLEVKLYKCKNINRVCA